MLKPLQKLKTIIKKSWCGLLLLAILIGSSYILLAHNKQLPALQDTTLTQKIKDHDNAVRAALAEHERLIKRINELALELQNLGKKNDPPASRN